MKYVLEHGNRPARVPKPISKNYRLDSLYPERIGRDLCLRLSRTVVLSAAPSSRTPVR